MRLDVCFVHMNTPLTTEAYVVFGYSEFALLYSKFPFSILQAL